MRGERHALFLDLAQLCERKHLKAAGIGQDRTVPGHEFVDAAELAHDFVARAQMQVVGVGELDLCADALQILSARDAPLIAACVPTFIKTGVWTVPCAHENSPRRAAPSCLRSLNIITSFDA